MDDGLYDETRMSMSDKGWARTYSLDDGTAVAELKPFSGRVGMMDEVPFSDVLKCYMGNPATGSYDFIILYGKRSDVMSAVSAFESDESVHVLGDFYHPDEGVVAYGFFYAWWMPNGGVKIKEGFGI